MDNPESNAPIPESAEPDLDEVIPVYANNVRFEMSIWDLRLLFGQLMPGSAGKGLVDWHTDVTIPWSQAKLMYLYLGINLLLYERDNGKIVLPAGVLPSFAEEPPPGIDTANPRAMETFEKVREMVRKFRESETAPAS